MPKEFLFMKRGRTIQRTKNRGFVLLTTLLGLTVFASLIIALQRLSSSNSVALARLTDRIEENIGKSSLYEQLRGPIADAMTGQLAGGIPINGSEIEIETAGRSWDVQVQDVESLVDVYLGSPDLIGLTLPNSRTLEVRRAAALQDLAAGERFPTLAASLARFGVTDPSVSEVTTQFAQHGSLRIANLPKELQHLARSLAPSAREGEQVNRVRVSAKARDHFSDARNQ